MRFTIRLSLMSGRNFEISSGNIGRQERYDFWFSQCHKIKHIHCHELSGYANSRPTSILTISIKSDHIGATGGIREYLA